MTTRRCKEHKGKELGAIVNLSITVCIGAGGNSSQANDRPPGTFMATLKAACNSLPLFEFLKTNIQYPPRNLPQEQKKP